ncbi:MAG: ASKHA domain-containing protein [Oscillospiraceae bacterium]|jgi:uncharacterized 2Fe-2S/4Fe-4S cluster protein (DUF4445 family)|nr:ASKHA domain-containing protein [Oscillospiraceae bacterium]
MTTTIDLPLPGETIYHALHRLGFFVDAPCGGNGKCGKCKVIADDVLVLACQTVAKSGTLVSFSGKQIISMDSPILLNIPPYAIAIDLGTTTITGAAIDRRGHILARLTEMNVQRSFGADVMSRLQAAESGYLPNLSDIVRKQIDGIAHKLLGGSRVETAVITGNTVMLHMLFGADCSGLGRYPYKPAFLDAQERPGSFFAWDWVDNILTPPCLHAFCGADIIAGLLTLTNVQRPYLLADLGTNAELALYTDRGLFVTSAAAGPVFEGAGISCGMSALSGAVCQFSLIGERAKIATITDAEPTGICASGLVDVLAELRRTYRLSTNGILAEAYQIAADVTLTQTDVRAFQLAKAAVAAGIELLCAHAGINTEELFTLAVAGSLGSALNPTNVVRLGLFGSAKRFSAIGESALDGVICYLISQKSREIAKNLAKSGKYIDLSLLPEFEEVLLKNIDFPA